MKNLLRLTLCAVLGAGLLVGCQKKETTTTTTETTTETSMAATPAATPATTPEMARTPAP